MASDSATALATQQSIKAYVDAQVDTADTLAEILAIGNTTGTTDIEVDGCSESPVPRCRDLHKLKRRRPVRYSR
jgi:hypothetical protein